MEGLGLVYLRVLVVEGVWIALRVNGLVFWDLVGLFRLHGLGGGSWLSGLGWLVQLREVKEWNVDIGGWHWSLSRLNSGSIVIQSSSSFCWVVHSSSFNRSRKVMCGPAMIERHRVIVGHHALWCWCIFLTMPQLVEWVITFLRSCLRLYFTNRRRHLQRVRYSLFLLSIICDLDLKISTNKIIDMLDAWLNRLHLTLLCNTWIFLLD